MGNSQVISINESEVKIKRETKGIYSGVYKEYGKIENNRVIVNVPKKVDISLVRGIKGINAEKDREIKGAIGKILSYIGDTLTSTCFKVGSYAICTAYVGSNEVYKIYEDVIDIWAGGNGAVVLTKSGLYSVGYDFTSDTIVDESVLPFDPDEVYAVSVYQSTLIVQLKNGDVYFLGKTPIVSTKFTLPGGITNDTLYSTPYLIGNFPLAKELSLQYLYTGRRQVSLFLVSEDGDLYYDDTLIGRFKEKTYTYNSNGLYVIEGNRIRRYYKDSSNNIVDSYEPFTITGEYEIYDKIVRTQVGSSILLDGEKAIFLGYFRASIPLDKPKENLLTVPARYSCIVFDKETYDFYRVLTGSSSFPLGGSLLGNTNGDLPVDMFSHDSGGEVYYYTEKGNIMGLNIGAGLFRAFYSFPMNVLSDGWYKSGKWNIDTQGIRASGVIIGNMVMA